MKEQFVNLYNTIRNNSNCNNIYYLANADNWGDALIRQGTLKFFQDFDINVTELKWSKPDWIWPVINGGLVLYGGGGAWCRNWNIAYKKE